MTESQANHIMKQNQAAYERVAQAFSATRQLPWPELDRFPEFITPGSRLLDIGCGNGRMVPWVKKRTRFYTGLEPVSGLLAEARQSHPKETFVRGDILDLPFPDQSFDACLLAGSLHHIPGPLLDQAAGELRRVLTAGGIALMTNWNLWQPRFWKVHVREWSRQFTGQSELDWPDLWIPFSTPDHKVTVQRYYHGFTRRELNRLAKDNGFQVLENRFVSPSGDATMFTGRNLLTVWRKLTIM